MKLNKHMQWLKEHLESQVNDTTDKLWDGYESSQYDNLGQDTLNLGWELSRIEMLTEVLDFIDTLQNPVYGDI